jgi:photosystem II stability/assembly factor-like uncharacterized protein
MRFYNGQLCRRGWLVAVLVISWLIASWLPSFGPPGGQVPPTPTSQGPTRGSGGPGDRKSGPGQRTAAGLNIAAYRNLPLAFEPTARDEAGGFQFRAGGNGCAFSLAADQLLFAFDLSPKKHVPARDGSRRSTLTDSPRDTGFLCMRLDGSNSAAQARGENIMPGRVNYLIGNDPGKWRVGVPTYERVVFEAVYAGVDLAYYGSRPGLEYDFIVAPWADPHPIRLSYPGANSAYVTAEGDLIVVTPAREVRFARPQAYQLVAGSRAGVPADYDLEGAEVGFRLGRYDPSFPLIIDPVLSYSTFLGGTQADQGTGIAVDGAGNAYVTGFTYSLDFPLANPYQSSNPFSIAFVSKLNASGTALVYSTFLGGTDGSDAAGIAVDQSGNAYIVGNTSSTDFPVVNAAQPTNAGSPDVFVAKLSPDGSSLTYSTYLGGSGLDAAGGIAVDSHGSAYVTGRTQSRDFPAVSPIQAQTAGGVDCFITKIDPSGHTLVYSTYLGGSGTDEGTSVAVDAQGNAYVAGATASPDFPTAAAFQTTFQAHTIMKAGNSSGVWSPADGSLPGNVGVLSIAVDSATPGTVFAGTNGSGLFRSNDGGGSWTPVNGGFPLRTVKTIATDPADHSVIYAGGVGGPAVYKSTDGGVSWHPAGNGLSSGFIEALLVYPADHNTVFAGTGIGLFITHDGGASWSRVFDSQVGGRDSKALIADPISSTVFLGTSGGIFKTTDGGMSWVPLFSPFYSVTSLAIDPTDHSVVYAGTLSSDIFKSTDGGAHWKLLSTGIPESLVWVLAMSADSSIYAGTLGDGVLRSTDAGSTWQPLNAGLSSASVQALAVGNGGSVIYEGSFQVFHGFVTKLNASGSGIVYSSLLGGNADDFIMGISVDSAGSAYVAGRTFSASFPTAGPNQSSNAGLFDAFVTKLSPSGSALAYSSFIGGSLDDVASGIAVDPAGNAFVAGDSFSADLHVVSPVQPASAGGHEAFVARLDASGAVSYCTYLGGQLDDMATAIAIDSAGDAYATGNTFSPGFPITPGSLKTKLGGQSDEDAFVVKLSPATSALAIVSAMVSGKQLLVFGAGFDNGAVVLLDGQQQKTQNDPSDATTKLVARKAGKKISPGQQVTLQVRDSSGALSPAFNFTRSP